MSNSLKDQFVAAQIVGGRERQEDDFAVLDLGGQDFERLVLVVADGMGGHAKAAEAARIAVSRFCDSIKTSTGPLSCRLRPALKHANHAIASAALGDTTLKGAGCTLVAAAIEDTALSWISVGDSSIYLFRKRTLRCLNVKHVGSVGTGFGPQQSKFRVLRSALMGKELRLIDSSHEAIPLATHDCLIVASDGLDCVGDQRLASILRRSAVRSPTETLDLLLRAVRTKPIAAQDNTTILLYRVPRTKTDFDGPTDQQLLGPKLKLLMAGVLSATVLLAMLRWLLG